MEEKVFNLKESKPLKGLERFSAVCKLTQIMQTLFKILFNSSTTHRDGFIENIFIGNIH